MPFALFVRDRVTRRARVAILAFAVLLSGLAVVTTAPNAEAATTVPLSVTVWRVVEIDDPDPADLQHFGDYYTDVTIGGVSSYSWVQDGFPGVGVGIVGSWTIEPFWNFSANVAANNTQVPVTIELWDEDNFLAGANDPIDINPAAGKTTLELTVNAVNGTWRGDTLTGTRSTSGGGDAPIERARIFFEISVGSTTGDWDGDGLLDGWERLGFDDDGDSIVDVDLPAFGASPTHKDVFVELDSMTGLAISRAEVAAVKAAFAAAPSSAGTGASTLKHGVDAAPNPDGMPGINLWVDTGSVIDPRVDEGGRERIAQCLDNVDNDGDGGVDSMPRDRDVDGIPDPVDPQCGLREPLIDIVDETGAIPTPLCADGIDNDGDGMLDALDPQCWIGDNLGGGNNIAPVSLSGVDAGFYALKGANFSSQRRFIFRYAISASDGLEDGATSPNSCSDGRDNVGDGLTDLFDPDCSLGIGGEGELGGNDLVDFNHNGGTLMHELGHNLNLSHGGDERHNCKPNYVSVMNYDHSFGISRDDGSTFYDYAPARVSDTDRGPPAVPDLSEKDLRETAAINGFDTTSRTVITDGAGSARLVALDTPPDWNGDGSNTVGTVAADIDIPGAVPSGATARTYCSANGSGYETLRSWDDWTTISLPFREFGNASDGAVNLEPEPRLTPEEWFATREALASGDIALSLSTSPTPAAAGGTIDYAATVSNQGINPADAVDVTVQLPAHVSFESGPGCAASGSQVACRINSIEPGAAGTTQFVARVDPAVLGGGTSTQVHTTSSALFAGHDTDVSDNRATATTPVIAVSDSAVVGVNGVDVPGGVLIGTLAYVTVETVITNGPTPADVEIAQTPFNQSTLVMSPLATVSRVEHAVRAGEQRRLQVVYKVQCTTPGPATVIVDGRATMVSPGHVEPNGSNDRQSGTFTIDCVIPVAVNVVPGDAANTVAPGAPFDVAVLTTSAGEYGLPLDVDDTMLDTSSMVLGSAQPPGRGFSGNAPAAVWLADSFEPDDVKQDGDIDTVAQFGAPGGEPHGNNVCVQGRVLSVLERPVWFYGCDVLIVGKPPD